MPKAFITGITGQDGSYLAELLLEKGYEVHGLVRRSTAPERSRISHLASNPEVIQKQLFLHPGDLNDPTNLRRTLFKISPDEVYHLAGQSHVGLSFDIPEMTCDVVGMGTLRLLEMIRDLPHPPKLFHAASSEIFGRPVAAPQDEETPVRPVTPYGCAKAFARQVVSVYRDTHKLFACNGILYNHESPRRGEEFVTRKIARGAAAIKAGTQSELVLGDTSARRDWGHARDYTRGMWLALQHQTPGDYVFATGELHTVQEVIEIAFATAGLDWRQHVRQDPRFLRPAESFSLLGNPAKAEKVLGWKREISFVAMVEEMTRAEMSLQQARRK